MVTAFAGAASILTPELVQTLMAGLMQGTCPPAVCAFKLLFTIVGGVCSCRRRRAALKRATPRRRTGMGAMTTGMQNSG
jgi:hypothetical protein